jgi:hypothetical protein
MRCAALPRFSLGSKMSVASRASALYRRTRPFLEIQAGDRMAGARRNRNGWFWVSNANKQTFVHGDCQRQPSTQSSGSATAAVTAGIDPKRR